MSSTYIDLPRHIISPWTTSLISSLCHTRGSNNLALHHSADLMSLMINYILMKPPRQVCHDHHQHFDPFQDINWIHDEKYHPCPRWFVLSSTTLFPSIQHKLVRVLCYTLSSMLSSLCYVLPWSITIFMSRMSWEFHHLLRDLDTGDTSCHIHSFLGPHVVSNRKTDNWTMMCDFKTSSNPIALKLMIDISFLGRWLSNHHSNIDRAT